MEENKNSPKEDKEPQEQDTEQYHESRADKSPSPPPPEPKTSGGGWRGWGFSASSVLADLQKAAEEISRNVRFICYTLSLLALDFLVLSF